MCFLGMKGRVRARCWDSTWPASSTHLLTLKHRDFLKCQFISQLNFPLSFLIVCSQSLFISTFSSFITAFHRKSFKTYPSHRQVSPKVITHLLSALPLILKSQELKDPVKNSIFLQLNDHLDSHACPMTASSVLQTLHPLHVWLYVRFLNDVAMFACERARGFL